MTISDQINNKNYLEQFTNIALIPNHGKINVLLFKNLSSAEGVFDNRKFIQKWIFLVDHYINKV